MANCKPALLLFVALLAAGPALAQGKDSGPSVYVRCDGRPTHRSKAADLARGFLLGATLGIIGRVEGQDYSKRAHGIDGVDACTLAVQQESDPLRKVELMLARAVHQIEKGDFAAALEDARGAPALAGPAAGDIGFRQTLLVSSWELQAAVQLRTGHVAEAEAAAIQMADAAPYEILAQIGAAPYVQLTGDLTPDKAAYLDRLVKIFPQGLVMRAMAREWAGRWLEAADDYAAISDSWTTFMADSSPPPLPAVQALRAVMLAMGGNMEESNAVAANVTAMIRVLSATGKSGLMKSSIDSAEQALDFRAIVQDLAEGRAGVARTKFAARSRWATPSAPVVAELATRLRRGAAAAELTGPLAEDPAKLRSEGLTANAGSITEANDAVSKLYDIRRPLDASDYVAWSEDVWDTKTSAFLHKRAPEEHYVGELLMVSRAPALFKPVHTITYATGEALLLHAALMAQARGAKGFVMYPNRQQYDAILIRYASPGDAGIASSMIVDAATVIAGLAPVIPSPGLKP